MVAHGKKNDVEILEQEEVKSVDLKVEGKIVKRFTSFCRSLNFMRPSSLHLASIDSRLIMIINIRNF